eukprot:gene1868-1009_t
MDVAWDMETGDPDDYFTLCILAAHPSIKLRCVTVTPGSPDQIGLVKTTLRRLKLDIPVGSRTPNYEKKCVGGFYRKIYPNLIDEEADGYGFEILAKAIKKYPDITLITGAPVCNLGKLLEKYPDIKLKKWVAQGGFAGDNVVPKEFRMKKFEGKISCPTYNFGGDPKSAEVALNSKQIESIILVSKNVCHSVAYGKELHLKMKALLKNRENNEKETGLDLLVEGMTKYLQKTEEKKFHDPLAVICFINPSICKFERVTCEREKNVWSSKLSKNSNTVISISVDKKEFEKELMNLV